MGVFLEMFMCRDSVLTLPITILSIRSILSANVLHSNSYYTVVAGIFLVSTCLVEQCAE